MIAYHKFFVGPVDINPAPGPKGTQGPGWSHTRLNLPSSHPQKRLVFKATFGAYGTSGLCQERFQGERQFGEGVLAY
jgi:hypothetical protein